PRRGWLWAFVSNCNAVVKRVAEDPGRGGSHLNLPLGRCPGGLLPLAMCPRRRLLPTEWAGRSTWFFSERAPRPLAGGLSRSEARPVGVPRLSRAAPRKCRQMAPCHPSARVQRDRDRGERSSLGALVSTPRVSPPVAPHGLVVGPEPAHVC